MKMKNRMILFIISISILMGVLTIQSEAANETNTRANQNITTQNTSNATQSTKEKSSNANLANLGIKPHDFTGFRYGTTTYEVEVPEDTEKVEVYATAQEENAKVTGTGNKILEKGENKAEVVVTAEDGTTKTYTINIIRKAQEKEKEEVTHIEEQGNGLAKLKINFVKLLPEFKTNVYEYTAKYVGEDTRLEIEATATDENYEIEVVGNDNLQEGENFITILVSEANGNNVATYQIKVNKSLVDEEAIAKEEALKKEKQQKIIIGAIVAIVMVAAIITGIVMTHKRNERLEREYAGDFYDRSREEENFEDEEEEDNEVPRALREEIDPKEEIPKALRGKRFKEDEEVQENKNKKRKFQEIEKVFEEEKEAIEEEEDFEKMPKDEVKEKFLNGYTSQVDFDYDDSNVYQNNRKKGKHKGKRFK